MSLAEGKVVLVLEGGYELNALAECGKLCIEALLNRPVKDEICLMKFFEYFFV
jgi:acetoin utilization deacetylase AcuC-like enzyme